MLALFVLPLAAAQGDLVASQFGRKLHDGVEFQEVALPNAMTSGDGPFVQMDGPFVVEEDEPIMFGGFGPDVFGPGGPVIGGPGPMIGGPGPMIGGPGPVIGGPGHGFPPGFAPVQELPFPPELAGVLSGPDLGGLPDGVIVVSTNMEPPRPRFRGGSRRGPGPVGGTLEMHISQRPLPLHDLAGAFGGLFNPLMVPLHHNEPKEKQKQNASDPHAGRPHHKNPFDAFIHDVVGEMGLKVGDMKKAAVTAAGGAPPACRNETKKYCDDAHPHVMHCLAEHSEDLSQGCKATVKKSLPAVCKAAIKKSCDTLEEGVLPCLKRLDADKKLTGNCADSFHATMKSIARVKEGLTYGATVVNQVTGIERPLVGPAEADSYYDRFRNFAGSLLEPDW
jgi:hypothetical protein